MHYNRISRPPELGQAENGKNDRPPGPGPGSAAGDVGCEDRKPGVALPCGTGFQPVRRRGQVENLSHKGPPHASNFSITRPSRKSWMGRPVAVISSVCGSMPRLWKMVADTSSGVHGSLAG